MAVKADLDLDAVVVEVVDANGAGFAFLLGPQSALHLIMHLIGALSMLEGTLERGATERVAEPTVRS